MASCSLHIPSLNALPQLVAVELPAIVKTEDKGLEFLGGRQTILHAIHSKVTKAMVIRQDKASNTPCIYVYVA